MKAMLMFLPLCAGCYSVATGGQLGIQLDAGQIAALGRLDAKTAAAVVDAMCPKVSVLANDVFAQVERTWTFTRDPKTGNVVVSVTANHRGDVEALKAALDGAGDIAGKVAGAVVEKAKIGAIPFVGPLP